MDNVRQNNSIPDQISGIPVDDERLEEEFGSPAIEPVILGGIVPSDNMKAFQRLPLKFRTYPKIKKDFMEIQTEGRASRQRWNIKDRKNFPAENHDAFRVRKEREEDERNPLQGNRVDFTKLRVTSLLCNKMTHMPKEESAREELMIASEKLSLLDTWDLYVKDNVDDKDNHKNSMNFTKQEELGRKEIQTGIKDRGWILYGTDKSGKLVLDTQENFDRAMEPHFKNETEVSINNVHASEPLLNNHSKSWASLLRMGQMAGNRQHERIKEALTVSKSSVPFCKGLRKDHKDS